MKKILLGFLLLLFTLTFNACVEKNIITNTNQEIIPIVVNTNQEIIPIVVNTNQEIIPIVVNTNQEIIPIPSSPRPITVAPSTSGEYHQLETVQGATLTVEERSNGFIFPQYRNKVVLLQIFGHDCPYCFKEMPIINRVKQQYAGALQIIAIQAQDNMSKQTASRVIQQFQMNYPIVDKGEARDLLYFMQKTYGWTGILPYMLLIKDGVTEYSFAGEVSHQELDEAVRSLI